MEITNYRLNQISIIIATILINNIIILIFMAYSGEQEKKGKCACNKLYACPFFVVFMSIKLRGLYPTIWRTQTPFFRRIRLIRCAYELLRCLHLEIWRFLC